MPGEFDILTAGFPCQPFTVMKEAETTLSTKGRGRGKGKGQGQSQAASAKANRGRDGDSNAGGGSGGGGAGRHQNLRGLDDPRGQLFLEIVRFLVQRQPRAFLLENVSNLLYVDGGERKTATTGRAFATIVRHLEAAGYVVTWRVISSCGWVAQHRERLYFVGFRADVAGGVDGAASAFVWPEHAVTTDPSGGGGTGTGTGTGGVEQRRADRGSQRATAADPTAGSGGAPLRTGGEGGGGGGSPRARPAAKCPGARYQCVGELLEDDATDPGGTKRAACVLTPAQWATVQGTDNYGKNPKRRLCDVAGDARTVVSSYRSGFRYYAEFVAPATTPAPTPTPAPALASASVRPLPRFYTPREVARLMGFPDSFRISETQPAQGGKGKGKGKAAKRQRHEPGEQGGPPPVTAGPQTAGRAAGACVINAGVYSELGNAVVPPVINAIGRQMLAAMRMLKDTS